MTDRPTDKVNYKLDAHLYSEPTYKIQLSILNSGRENHIFLHGASDKVNW